MSRVLRDLESVLSARSRAMLSDAARARRAERSRRPGSRVPGPDWWLRRRTPLCGHALEDLSQQTVGGQWATAKRCRECGTVKRVYGLVSLLDRRSL